MKGKLIMRFVGNKQEPEEEPEQYLELPRFPALSIRWWEEELKKVMERLAGKKK